MIAQPPDGKGPSQSLGWLLAIFALAVAARALDIERVFVGEGEGQVVFAAGDAFYHARRALHSFVAFPALLRFDPCLNFPFGAHVPHPPLLDWSTAALARVFGASRAGFETTAAWIPVVFASAAVLPIHALGRDFVSAFAGRLAAAIYAVLPICINYGQLGNFDHHAPAGFFGAALVWLYARSLGEPGPGRGVQAGLFALRLALMLTWTGSLLYLVPGEAALLLAGTARGQSARLRALAGWAAATAAVAWPLAAWLGRPDGSGAFAAVEFSRLHGLVYAGLALLALACAEVLRRRPEYALRERLATVFALALPVVGLALLVPGVCDGLRAGLGFLAADDGYTETVVEQLPLFWGHGSYSLAIAHARMGGFVYLIPFVPIAFARLVTRSRSPWAMGYLAAWSLLMAFLAVGQVRYAHDFAPVGCVGFAALLLRLGEVGGMRAWWPFGPPALAVSAASLLALFSVPGFYAPTVGLLWHGLRGELETIDRALLSVPGSQLRFAQRVDEILDPVSRCTPGTSDAPAAGVLAHVGLGHVLHYAAQRATPADPFGPYIGRAQFRAVEDFWNATSEARAVAILDASKTPWVASAADALPRPRRSMAIRLHEHDGSFVPGVPALGRLRLVYEGPTGGLAMATLFGDDRESFAPYKLFERVEGALLELEVGPGRSLTAELPLKTPSGRRFVYRAAVRAGAAGVARLRVPYANPKDRPRVRLDQPVSRVVALGPYTVEAGARAFRIHVSEREVKTGARVPIEDFEHFAGDAGVVRYSRLGNGLSENELR